MHRRFTDSSSFLYQFDFTDCHFKFRLRINIKFRVPQHVDSDVPIRVEISYNGLQQLAGLRVVSLAAYGATDVVTYLNLSFRRLHLLRALSSHATSRSSRQQAAAHRATAARPRRASIQIGICVRLLKHGDRAASVFNL